MNRHVTPAPRPVKAPSTPALRTLYLSPADIVDLVRRKGLVACLAGVVDRIERDFRRWADFDKAARVASYSQQGAIELMPIADARAYGFKYVTCHPGNARAGLPTVMGFGALAEAATGRPLLLSEMTLTTAIRTAATSIVAARALARPDSRCMAIIGNGAQSEFQALAFHHLMGISRVRLFDVDAKASAKLARNLRKASALDVEICKSAASAVQGADIVTTVTADKAQARIVTPDMIAPGVHYNAVGGDAPGKTEFHPDALRAASIFVEFEPQTRVEGEIQQLAPDHPVTALWHVLTGRAPGRARADQITLFDSVGFALEDLAALIFMHETARELRLGEEIALIAQSEDPKDLFGLLREGGA